MRYQSKRPKRQFLAGVACKQCGELTGDELTGMAAQKDRPTGKLRGKYGWACGKAGRQIDDFFRDKG